MECLQFTVYRKFTVSVHFGAQFTARKPKILQKTKFSAKTVFLGPGPRKITEFFEN